MEEKRKKSLFRYIGIMFAVAFILVLVSLIGQTKNISELSKSSVSALQNAEQLQEDNRRLQQQVVSLTEEKLDLADTVEELEQTIEELNTENKEYQEEIKLLQQEIDGLKQTQEEVDEQ